MSSEGVEASSVHTGNYYYNVFIHSYCESVVQHYISAPQITFPYPPFKSPRFEVCWIQLILNKANLIGIREYVKKVSAPKGRFGHSKARKDFVISVLTYRTRFRVDNYLFGKHPYLCGIGPLTRSWKCRKVDWKTGKQRRILVTALKAGIVTRPTTTERPKSQLTPSTTEISNFIIPGVSSGT